MTRFMRDILLALEDGDMTAFDIADLLGVSVGYVNEYGVAPLHKIKLIRISEWLRGKYGRIPMRVFSITNGKDAPRPKRQSDAEIMRRLRRRQKDATVTNSLAVLAMGFRRMK